MSAAADASVERPERADTAAGPDTGRYLDYLRTNRDFTAEAVGAAVATLDPGDLGRPLRILDAGTGAGGALPGLAGLVRRAARRGSVLAVDLDARAVDAAAQVVDQLVLAAWVELRTADLHQVAGEARISDQRYDLVWSSDVGWPATFEDPAEVVATLAGALVPGGTLALFTTNYYQSMFLPGHSRLERLIRTASELTWGLPLDGATHHERLGAWLREAGLVDRSLRVFPVSAPVAQEGAARAYCERIVWPEMRHAVSSRGRAAGMTSVDLEHAEELLDPGSPSWVGADHDAFVVQPTLLWTGRASV